MKWLALAVILVSAHAWGVITYVGYQNCISGAINCTNSVSNVAVGDTILLTNQRAAGGQAAITGTCASQWQVYLSPSGSTAAALQLSIATSTVSGACSITASNTAGTNGGWVAAIYRDVASVVTPDWVTVMQNTPCNTNYITPTAANAVVVGLLYVSNNTDRTFTAISGSTLRASNIPTQNYNARMAIADQTVVSSTAVISGASFTPGTNGNCSAIGVVLLPAAVLPPVTTNAVLSHQSKTVVLNTPAALSQYALPNTMISPSWCTYVLGAQDSTVTVAASALLNTQANSLDLRAWNMSRMCQDAQSNYWASAPILTGAGVSATRTPTGIQLSLSARIAGGGMRLGGGVLGAGRCRMTTANAKGVSPEDVVNFSLAEDPRSIPGFAYLGIGVAAKPNQVDFRVCNRSGRTMKLSAFTLNWEAE